MGLHIFLSSVIIDFVRFGHLTYQLRSIYSAFGLLVKGLARGLLLFNWGHKTYLVRVAVDQLPDAWAR